ncbi:hypothetical protein VCHA29O37_520001 [Vibrio chagasii]|nr:hypothetical protein VCHA29O37_520001 [Vibrio chagasii]
MLQWLRIMTRFSAVQKEILIILTKAFIGGVKEAKSTDVNALVNRGFAPIPSKLTLA